MPPFCGVVDRACAVCSTAGQPKVEARPPLVAFPGAEGFGALASGGRGGTIYHVSNLDDHGPGSFRDAVGTERRIVVFDVGGYIDLASPVSVASNITIAGQTAPGEGICLKNYSVSFAKSHNVIVRYIRLRQGLTPKQEKKYTVGLGECHDVVLDHVLDRVGPLGLHRLHRLHRRHAAILPDRRRHRSAALRLPLPERQRDLLPQPVDQ